MAQGYGVDGSRINSGQTPIARDQELHLMKWRTEDAARSRAMVSEDDTIIDPLRSYHAHVKTVLQGHISDYIALRDENPTTGYDPAYAPIVEALQAVYEDLFGGIWDKPWGIVEDVMPDTQETPAEPIPAMPEIPDSDAAYVVYVSGKRIRAFQSHLEAIRHIEENSFPVTECEIKHEKPVVEDGTAEELKDDEMLAGLAAKAEIESKLVFPNEPRKPGRPRKAN